MNEEQIAAKSVAIEKEKKKNKESNAGYHAGDLGKAESLGNQSGGRDTGHFGTGTYFVGNKELVKDYNRRDGASAPQHAVDFSNYNLFKPKNYSDGVKVHNFLGTINNFWRNNGITDRYKSIEEVKNATKRADEIFDDATESLSDGKSNEELKELISLYEKAFGKRYVSQQISRQISSVNNGRIDVDENPDYVGNLKAIELLGDWAYKPLNDMYYDLVEEYYPEDIIDLYDSIDDISNILGVDSQDLKNAMEDSIKEVQDLNLKNEYKDSNGDLIDSVSTRVMKKLGFDGVDVIGIEGLDNTTYGSVIYDLKEPTILYSEDDYAPTFYSHMGKTIDEMKQDKVGAKDVVNYLKGKGVKDEEIKWSGIEEFLEGKKSVTKAELQEFVAGSMLQIEEVTLDNNETPYTQEQQEEIDFWSNKMEDDHKTIASLWKKTYHEDLPEYHNIMSVGDNVLMLLQDKVFSARNNTPEGKAYTRATTELKEMITRNDDFGFDNFREALATIARNPKDFAELWDMDDTDREIARRYAKAQESFRAIDLKSLRSENDDIIQTYAERMKTSAKKIQNVKSEHYQENAKHMSKWGEYTLDGGKNYREITFKLPNSTYSNPAMQGHWGEDAKGILAHARVQDFEVDGKKMLFIEEIQSDWHNEGNKRGYIAKNDADVRAKRQELENYIKSRLGKENSAEEIAKLREARAEYIRLGHNMSNADAVPDAPFKDNYHEFVLKNLIRMAAEQGYDSIGWTPADVQSKRWSDEFAEGYRIEYDQDIPKFLNKYGKKWGAKVGRTPMEIDGETGTTYYVDDRGNKSRSYNDLIDKILSRHGIDEANFNDYQAAFIDDETVKILNPKDESYFDEEIHIVTEPASVWSMPITDSMRDSVLYEGQVLYSEDGRWTTDRNEINTTRTKMDKVKETANKVKDKATDVANKAIDVANKIPGVELEHIEGEKANIADIVDMIKDSFDIPISTGKVTTPSARGIYKPKAEAIRTRIANNLPTISHELGHHLDNMYDYALSKLGSVKNLRASLPQEFLNQYPESKRNGEAVAEFVRIYLRNTNTAKEICPDFYYDFIKALSPEDLRTVDIIANVSNEYLSSTFSERVQSSIVSGNTKEKTSLSEKAKKMHADWIDGYSAIKDVTDYVEETLGISLSGRRNAYTLATNSRNARAIANFNTVHGFRNINGNIVPGAKSFIECIADVHKKNLKTLDEYLVLKHSLEWIAPQHEDATKKRVFGDDTLEDVESIKKRIAEIDAKHPEMKQAAENLYEYQRNILKYIVMPAGGMTADTFKSLYEKYPCYVPFYRAVESKKGGKTKGTFANQTSPLKRAKGSGELIISPIESIINNTDKMVKFALRNQTMQVLANYANTVDGFGKFIEQVPPDMLPHSVDIAYLKGKFEKALQQVVNSGEDFFAVSNLLDETFGDSVTGFSPIANAKHKIVTVLNNGQFSYYQVHDDALYEAIAEFTPQQLSGIFTFSHEIMQRMKLVITQNNPIFAVTNMARDIGTAYKHSPINNPIEFANRYVLAAKEVLTKGEVYKQWQALGGGHNSELSANLNQIKATLNQVAQKDMGKARRLLYAIFRHPIETIAALNDYTESIPRVMEFKRTLDAGGDLQSAIFNADDITTNFKKSGKGTFAKQTNSVVMFNNAALQGLNKAYRTLTNKNTTERSKTLLKWGLSALLLAAIQVFWNKDEDEEGYENLSSYKKNNFYNFAIGDGKFISIPKARETALLDSFTERTIELI